MLGGRGGEGGGGGISWSQILRGSKSSFAKFRVSGFGLSGRASGLYSGSTAQETRLGERRSSEEKPNIGALIIGRGFWAPL